VKKLRLLLLIVLLGIFIYSGGNLAFYLYDGYTSNNLNDRLKKQYVTAIEAAEINSEGISEDDEGGAAALMQQHQALYEQRFASLREINSEIVGWISIADTSIDYPVVQHSDNDYYLDHNIERSRSSRGAIFMDYRNERMTEDPHIVIYGHHMKDGSMFSQLYNYKDEQYFHEHSLITLDTLEQPTTWQIVSAYVYSPQHQFFQLQYGSEQEHNDYLQQIMAASLYDTGLEITAEDQLLTLVTCTYEISDARFIVHAKRVE